MKTHRDLEVWKKSIDLVVQIYSITKNFPTTEKFGLISQMQRCSVSIPSNIAEGSARKSSKEFSHFLSISLGSLAELETQLIISNRLKFLNDIVFKEINDDKIMHIRKMLIGLKKAVEKTIKSK